MKKIILGTIVVVALLAISFVAFYIFSDGGYNKKYQDAKQKYEDGDIEGAKKDFEKISDRDSAKKALNAIEASENYKNSKTYAILENYIKELEEEGYSVDVTNSISWLKDNPHAYCQITAMDKFDSEEKGKEYEGSELQDKDHNHWKNCGTQIMDECDKLCKEDKAEEIYFWGINVRKIYTDKDGNERFALDAHLGYDRIE